MQNSFDNNNVYVNNVLSTGISIHSLYIPSCISYAVWLCIYVHASKPVRYHKVVNNYVFFIWPICAVINKSVLPIPIAGWLTEIVFSFSVIHACMWLSHTPCPFP